ncbi:MAG TPA: CrcB family protein, partial [Rhizobiaceae bacterium]|nr:CrcB family protein [Rhizobiaceae bacterium]
ELRLFLATGLLGGFTTFSAFSLDFAALWERGATAAALGYALSSVFLSIAAVFAGLWMMRAAA